MEEPMDEGSNDTEQQQQEEEKKPKVSSILRPGSMGKYPSRVHCNVDKVSKDVTIYIAIALYKPADLIHGTPACKLV